MIILCVCTASERQESLVRRCSTLSVDSQSLREQVESLTAELEGHKETEAQLHTTQASLQARMYVTLLRKIPLIWAEDVLFSEVSSLQGLK